LIRKGKSGGSLSVSAITVSRGIRKANGDPALRYPHSTRPAGHFCLERYHLSLNLREHIAQAMLGKVWNIVGENFAAIPTVNHQGILVLYGIVFSLDRVKKRPADLDMCSGSPT
jgi:hypothetical protein